MYYDVYIDIVFLTNLLMDYVLLRIVGKLFLRKRNRGRILLAAAVGALFSKTLKHGIRFKMFWKSE